MDLLDFTAARHSLEGALALAKDTGSLHWTRVSAGALARCLIAERDTAAAEALLDATLERHAPFRTLGQRVIATARVELALAAGDGHRALDAVTSLIDTAGADGQAPPPRLGLLRGTALLMLDDRPGAEAALREAAESALERRQRGLFWRTHAALAHAYRSWGRRTEAREQGALAEAGIEELALTLENADARASFRNAALATLPPAPQLSPNRAAKEAFEGLTEREREVAALIADGRSNPEIAAELVVSVRTVESHVSSILATLGFGSRAQIAAWAAERGLKPR
jgi:DNA-binding CsgD family transcriptional regulator